MGVWPRRNLTKRSVRWLIFFISTKGGIDCLDLMAHLMTTKRQTQRWPMFVFFHILNMASNVIFKIKFPEHELPNQDNRRLFQLDIAMSFLLPQIERRRLLNNLPIQLTTSMDLVLDTKSHTSCTCLCSQEKEMCQMSIKGRQKTFVACCKCDLPICKDHTAYYCLACPGGQ